MSIFSPLLLAFTLPDPKVELKHVYIFLFYFNKEMTHFKSNSSTLIEMSQLPRIKTNKTA